MYIKIDKNDYEVSTNLGTAYDIEAKYGKKIAELTQGIESFNLDKCLEIIYFGFKRKNDMSFEDFKHLVFESDNIGVVDLQKELIVFFKLLITKDQNEKQVREELKKLYEEGLKKEQEKEQGEEPKNE